MKAILSLVAVMSLAACGTAKNSDSQTNGFPGFTVSLPQPLTQDVVVFSHDARPVDGDLKVVTLNRTEDGKYDLTVRSAFFDRLNGQAVDKTDDLAYGMTCNLNRGDYSCQVDQRPVDGALNVLSVEKGEFGYTAKLVSTWFDRISGKEESKETILGGSLELIQAAN